MLRITPQPTEDRLSVLTEAALAAATRLEMSSRALARVIGVSEATVSRMRKSGQLLPAGKAFELSALFVRLYRSLDAIAGGDDRAAAAWLRSENIALGGKPLDLIQSVSGLTHVIGYLDTRRALV